MQEVEQRREQLPRKFVAGSLGETRMVELSDGRDGGEK
jgi:hypothetical protein